MSRTTVSRIKHTLDGMEDAPSLAVASWLCAARDNPTNLYIRTKRNTAIVWAMGDIADNGMFKHSGDYEGEVVIDNVAREEQRLADFTGLPHAVFTEPQIGAVGQSDYAEQEKPKALGETEGFMKLVSDAETEELLGAHIVDEQGADIVHELVLAIELDTTAEDVANTIHIYPTLSEVINSAAGGVHKPS